MKANCIHDLTCYLHAGYVQSRFAAIYIEHKHIFLVEMCVHPVAVNSKHQTPIEGLYMQA